MIAGALASFILLRPHAHANVAPMPMRNGVVVARMPAPASAPWDASSIVALQRDVRAALAPALEGAGDWSCAVISQDGRILYDDRAAHAVIPASSQKLVVADAALSVLGDAYRFDTLLASGTPPQNGSISGDLWLIGSGDPSLRFGDVLGGAAMLRAAGIRSVAGNVVVDPSAVAGEEINPYWDASDANEDFMAATSGISLNEDTVEFDVTGTAAGGDAQIDVKPQSGIVRYSGAIVTGDGDDVVIAGTGTPNVFRVYGTIPPGVRERYWLPVHGIAQYAGAVADSFFRRMGIAIGGTSRTGTAPVDAHVLWEHRSAPLHALVKHMLVHSDNHYAEQFMRIVGAANGSAANDQDGIDAEISVLERQGVPRPGLHLVDGSGLARANRVAAITLARTLDYFNRAPGGNVLYPLLARGGLDGTLRWYRFGSAAGRVRAKSGHVAGVAALAGYVDTKMHGRVAFAFIVNGSPGDPDRAIVSAVDRIAAR